MLSRNSICRSLFTALSLALVGSIMSICNSASAATVSSLSRNVGVVNDDSDSGSGPDSRFGVSSTDLINAGQPTLTSVTLTSGAIAFGSLAQLNNGPTIYGAGTNSGPANSFGCNDGSVVEVLLNTTLNPLGYDISSVVALTGYIGTNQVSQIFNLEYSVVGNPLYVAVPGDSGFTVNRLNSAPNNEMQVTISNISGATGVDALRFTFFNGPSGGNVYREIDVFQVEASTVPEPSTLGLAALGLAALGLVAWRKRK